MKRLLVSALVVGTLSAGIPQGEAQAQVILGAHIPYASDVFDGSFGIGGRVGWDPPILPIDIVGVGEYFFPDCGASDCSFWGASVEANVRLPIPIVRPYITGGLGYRSAGNLPTSGDTVEDISESGVSLGAGLDFNLMALRLFADGRYEWYGNNQLEQAVFRVGVLF